MSTFEHNVMVDRPIEGVFEFMHNPANDPLWQPTLAESRKVSEGPIGVGTVLAEVRHLLGKRLEWTFEVTEYEPPRKSSVRSKSSPIPFDGSYILEPAGGGTSVTIRGEMNAHGFFKLAEPVFARLAQRELESNAGHLKDVLEAGLAAEEPVGSAAGAVA